MPKKRKQKRKRTNTSAAQTGTLSALRKEAKVVMTRLRRAGQKQLAAIESQIDKLSRQRDALLDEINAAVGGRGRRSLHGRRGGRRSRVNWERVFAKLPKGPFKASHVREIVPGVAAGTLSQRLTGWVRQKKLKRTGSRRGTSYMKAA